MKNKEKKTQKTHTKQYRLSKNCETTTDSVTYVKWEYQKKKETFETIAENFPQIPVKHQTIDPISLENIKISVKTYTEKATLRHIVLKLQKIKDKE